MVEAKKVEHNNNAHVLTLDITLTLGMLSLVSF